MKEYLLELAAELRGMAIRIEAHAADPDGRAARACGREFRSLRTGEVVGESDQSAVVSGQWKDGNADKLGSGMWAQWADAERDGAAGGEDEVVKVVRRVPVL